ncbi:hypothetical protein OO015_07985 [Thermomicrobium sp. 4228-Ro]|uniref:hypothetical protein n=1 Tax=Thermomicrobium sp. 4228-Ro TaxID=2993937 RepID=UPI002248E6D9|nr:hypothetical protein [Thermomicrobium sp. 4228-Ro]MCX2727432.1 hypothetical protein [Thermomicrobium sp. 4228-Ro]
MSAPPPGPGGPAHRSVHWLKRALWVLVVANVLLAVAGILDTGTVLVVVGLLEAAALTLALALPCRALRAARHSGESRTDKVLIALSSVLPDRLARFIVLELITFSTLARWFLRRVPAPAQSFTYRKRSMLGVVLLLVLLTTPGELVLVHAVLPWTWARWVAAAVSVYALLWLLALWASLRVHPHEIDDGTLVLRWLYLHAVHIPLDTVHAVVERSERSPVGVTASSSMATPPGSRSVGAPTRSSNSCTPPPHTAFSHQ